MSESNNKKFPDDFLTADLADGWVTFKFSNPGARPRVVDLAHLYKGLRKALQEVTGDSSWRIRFASQVKNENMPFLHSSATRTVLLDPLAHLRDPVRELVKDGYLSWQIYPSQVYYFKPVEEVNRVRSQEVLIRSTLNATRKSANSSNDQEAGEADE